MQESLGNLVVGGSAYAATVWSQRTHFHLDAFLAGLELKREFAPDEITEVYEARHCVFLAISEAWRSSG